MDIEKQLVLGTPHSTATASLRPSFDHNLSRQLPDDSRKGEICRGHDEQQTKLQFDNVSSGSSISEEKTDGDIEKGPDAVNTPDAPAVSPSEDPNLVNWDGPSDPDNPQNWSLTKKWYITMILSCLTFCITFSSSIFSQATVPTAKLYGVSTEVTTLETSLFVLGFAIGPLIWGPLSELYGRMIPLFVGFAVFTVFQIPVAVAQDLQTIMVFRFLCGVFGCAPLAIVAGALADFWDPVSRGVSVALFAASTFLGPVAGPIAGGFIVHSHLGWRWTAWVTLIAASVFGIIAVFTVPETFAPVILQRRAARLRLETRNWALHSALDEHSPTMAEIVTKYLSRPLRMLFLEPILLFITIYISLVYGILYLFFFAYPVSFQQVRGWEHPGIAALPFLGLSAGVTLGCLLIIYLTKTRFARKVKEQGHVVPEERLAPMVIAAFSLPIGLFWFSWTSSPEISWVPQVMAGIPIGLGIIVIFLQGLNYIVDVYLTFANSAIAANTLIRSALGAAFPLFAVQMFHNLGVQWAGSLLALLAVAMIPVPILFYRYGARIRAMSRYSPQL